MPRFMLDTSCMVAAVCAWHQHHALAATDFERRRLRGETLVVAGPTLVETYAVLTRLPPPHRLSPSDAGSLVQANFVQANTANVEIVSLDADDYGRLITQSSDVGISGGQTYDAVIATCAMRARVDTLLTFNARHFERFSSEELSIAVPGAASDPDSK